MPDQFNFTAPVSLAFGNDRIRKLGRDVKRLAGTDGPVLLVADPVFAKNGLAHQIQTILEESGFESSVYSEIRSDPLATSIDEISGLVRRDRAACIVALGGGSTMDAAKLAACIAPSGENATAFALAEQPLPGNGIPKIAIPTTAGTGSESTRISVFSSAGQKLWAAGDRLRFDSAILDPSLTVGLPPHLTAATGIDAAVHAIESATCRKRNPVTTAIALGAIRLLRRWLTTAVHDGSNIEARGQVQLAATMAGMAIDITGVGIAHCIGHALGEYAGVHHGRAVGLALNATMQDTLTAVPESYAEIADALGAETQNLSANDAAQLAAPAFSAWLRDVELKTTLDDHNLTPSDATAITRLCQEPQNKIMLVADSFAYTPDLLETAVMRVISGSSMSASA